jgi:microcompartment protein CcmK/EutM
VLIGRVVGTVVASKKEPTLDGSKLLLVENTSPKGEPKGAFVVAVDAVGAGLGDLVLYASGSSARQTKATENRPVDATVMAIIDLVEEQGEWAYNKSSDS